jgi:hypothetical protein
MTQTLFERFRYSFFDDPYSARDGLDIEALQALEGGDRAKAEDLLLAYLPDARGIIGLAVLRSQKAGMPLQTLFNEHVQALHQAQAAKYQGWQPWKLIEGSKALWLIGPRPEYRDALIDVYNFLEDDFARLHAVEALYVVNDPVAVQALTRALDDRDKLVRHHAGRALLAIHGLSSEAGQDQEHMLYRVMSDDARRRESGKTGILAAIAGQPIAAPN